MIGLIFAAIILAGGTAYLLRDYLSAKQAEFASQAPKAPTLKILVAGADMPLGTVIGSENTQWLDWPEDGIQDGYLVQSKDANILATLKKDKHITRRAFAKGEPITMAHLYKSKSPGFLRGALNPGMRAIAVRTSPESGAAGFILPGDKVDVMLSHTMLNDAVQRLGENSAYDFSSGMMHTSETILEDVLVLAVDQNVNQFKEGAQLGKTLLLEVSSKDAEKLQTAKAMGQISLVLRSAETLPTDIKREMYTTDVEVSPLLSNFENFISGAKSKTTTTPQSAKPQAQAPAPVYRAPKRQPQKQTPQPLSIYRGVTGSTGNVAQ
jgi:pilus assembly protein CpaB